MHLVVYMRGSQLKVEYTHPMHYALDVDVGEVMHWMLMLEKIISFGLVHLDFLIFLDFFFFSFVIIYHFRL